MKSAAAALASGLVEKVLEGFDVWLQGFGGATVLDGGKPLSCKLFLQEMSRLGCNMTFLRRSYKRDIVGRDAAEELNILRNYWSQLQNRSGGEIVRDHKMFLKAVKKIEGIC